MSNNNDNSTFAALAILGLIVGLFSILFPNKKERFRRKRVFLERRLNLKPAKSGFLAHQYREEIQIKRVLDFVPTENGCDIYLKKLKWLGVQVVCNNKAKRYFCPGTMQIFSVNIEGVGCTYFTNDIDCVFEPVKTGDVSRGECIGHIYTSGSIFDKCLKEVKKAQVERERAEQERMMAIEQAERERRERIEYEKSEEYQKELIAEKLRAKQRKKELEDQVRQELIAKGELPPEKPKRARKTTKTDNPTTEGGQDLEKSNKIG